MGPPQHGLFQINSIHALIDDGGESSPPSIKQILLRPIRQGPRQQSIQRNIRAHRPARVERFINQLNADRTAGSVLPTFGNDNARQRASDQFSLGGFLMIDNDLQQTCSAVTIASTVLPHILRSLISSPGK